MILVCHWHCQSGSVNDGSRFEELVKLLEYQMSINSDLRKIIERLRTELTNNAIIADEIQKLCSEMQ